MVGTIHDPTPTWMIFRETSKEIRPLRRSVSAIPTTSSTYANESAIPIPSPRILLLLLFRVLGESYRRCGRIGGSSGHTVELGGGFPRTAAATGSSARGAGRPRRSGGRDARHYLVAPLFLRGEERVIGGGDQRLEVVSVARIARHSEGAGDPLPSPARQRIGDAPADALAQDQSAFRIGAREDEEDLVAAVLRDHVGGADLAFQELGQPLQTLAPGEVSVLGVVL